LCSSLLFLVPIGTVAGTFDLPELQVTPSPAQACSIQLDGVEKVLDFDVSPAGPQVAALVKSEDGDWRVLFWRVGAQKTSVGWNAPAGFVPRSIAWHPRAHSLFLTGSQGTQFHVIRLDKEANGWTARRIFNTPNELRRLVIGPSPFVVGREKKNREEVIAYRLFFGMKNADGTYRTVSITEEGKLFYQVIGPAETVNNPEASRLIEKSALPAAFHPAGHVLIWEDGGHNFRCAGYFHTRWKEHTSPLLHGMLKGGSVTPTPNGLGLLHWRPSSPGIGLFLVTAAEEQRQATAHQFVSTPSSVPDGRGIVGLTRSGRIYTLNYVPISVPLADVANAWMFCESGKDVSLLDKSGGLFRPLENDQLYQLYESEFYACGGYDRTLPTRPYLVTTDIFWELFAAAYQGLFIVKERHQAMPAFWKFVAAADQYYEKSTAPSHWRPVFRALSDLRSKDRKNPETARIRAAEGVLSSETLGVEVDYGELKPRGHYTSSPAMQDYFRAFRYLTSVYSKMKEQKQTLLQIMDELKLFPPEVKKLALTWVRVYRGFISPSRAPLVWKDRAADRPAYSRHPDPIPSLFPLSWGFDNEVLLSTVYHPDWPPAERIIGPGGLKRLIPSGVDIAAALGSRFADSLLETEYAKYPPLRQVVQNLKKLYDAKGKASTESPNLYDRWITALALQWADDVRPPDGGRDENIWRAKRLQTGLASWATLRHTTILVNERTSAECGEGGFEEIVSRAPRGYVEPDPRTFAAIAALFETAVTHVGRNFLKAAEKRHGSNYPDKYLTEGSESLRQGIIRRLTETAEKARLFQSIAEKEVRGEILSSREYEEILHVGRVAEHHFLVFKSLANKDYALSKPDPIPKIADVAGSRLIGFLMAAVGKPAEWDHVVPYFGRRQVVKGSVYSYYEFVSRRLLNDQEWRGMVKSQSRRAWVKPFFVEEKLSCPADTHYGL